MCAENVRRKCAQESRQQLVVVPVRHLGASGRIWAHLGKSGCVWTRLATSGTAKYDGASRCISDRFFGKHIEPQENPPKGKKMTNGTSLIQFKGRVTFEPPEANFALRNAHGKVGVEQRTWRSLR